MYDQNMREFQLTRISRSKRSRMFVYLVSIFETHLTRNNRMVLKFVRPSYTALPQSRRRRRRRLASNISCETSRTQRRRLFRPELRSSSLHCVDCARGCRICKGTLPRSHLASSLSTIMSSMRCKIPLIFFQTFPMPALSVASQPAQMTNFS
jgi:hypothetical protein